MEFCPGRYRYFWQYAAIYYEIPEQFVEKYFSWINFDDLILYDLQDRNDTYRNRSLKIKHYLADLEEAILCDNILQIGSLLTIAKALKIEERIDELLKGTRYEDIETFLRTTVFQKPVNPEAFDLEFSIKHNLHPSLNEKETLCLLLSFHPNNLYHLIKYEDLPSIIEKIRDNESRIQIQKFCDFFKDLVSVEELLEFNTKYNIY
jgi:hypothetical protein